MKKIAIALLSFAPLASFAHPGHGETGGYSIIHYFTEPVHAIVTLSVFALAYVVVRVMRKRKA